MHEINFDSKPSKLQVIKAIKDSIQQGYTQIALFWGENWIELEYSFNARSWIGQGWIKNLGGDDIANELNKQQKRG